MRTVEWDANHQQLKMIDQRVLPARLEYLYFRTAGEVADAIRDMVVRGAPAIGVSAAFGLALAALQSRAQDLDALRTELKVASEDLLSSRPTAVNLAWALRRMMTLVDSGQYQNSNDLSEALLLEAQRISDEDIETNQRMGRFGSVLIEDGDTIIHHCNTGSLAAVDWGTALGVIRAAHEEGKRLHVLVDETRPRLQGARLTAWELSQLGISYEIITDGSAGYFLKRGDVQKVLFGADRVSASGDVANKIGTYMLALAAHANGVPVYAVVPTSTIDLSIVHGEDIPIEERDPQEVLDIQYHGESVTPKGSLARNPAFDVTPNHLITAIVTDRGVLYPPFIETLRRAIETPRSRG